MRGLASVRNAQVCGRRCRHRNDGRGAGAVARLAAVARCPGVAVAARLGRRVVAGGRGRLALGAGQRRCQPHGADCLRDAAAKPCAGHQPDPPAGRADAGRPRGADLRRRPRSARDAGRAGPAGPPRRHRQLLLHRHPRPPPPGPGARDRAARPPGREPHLRPPQPVRLLRPRRDAPTGAAGAGHAGRHHRTPARLVPCPPWACAARCWMRR